MEYLTAAEIREQYGDEIVALTDATLLRRLDALTDYMEGSILGHTFGRAARVQSSLGTDTVQVLADRLVIGGDTYAFATYTTLGALEDAVNAAADTYSMELLANVDPGLPSTLLKTQAVATIGATYDKRVTLDITATRSVMDGKRQDRVFLPLAIRSVVSVVEDSITLASTSYWTPAAGESWLIRKNCGCGCYCNHPTGRWSNYSPHNIIITYKPALWGRVPGAVKGALLEAFGARSGLGEMQSESFIDYSYTRATATARTWAEALGGPELISYAVKLYAIP